MRFNLTSPQLSAMGQFVVCVTEPFAIYMKSDNYRRQFHPCLLGPPKKNTLFTRIIFLASILLLKEPPASATILELHIFRFWEEP